LGKNTADYLASVSTPWNGSVMKMHQDLLGANGWSSLEEVFYALNNTVNYVVLRNVNALLHGDIDILTDDREQFRLILNLPVGLFCSPVQAKFSVGGQPIKWDVRHVGDDYYCRQWEQDMLQDRILCPGNVYGLSDEHYFHSLVYHALLHKKAIPEDYYTEAERLVNVLSPDQPSELFPHVFDYYFDLLGDYMRRKNYVFCRPAYWWSSYNSGVAGLIQISDRLEKRFGMENVKPIHVRKTGSQDGLKGHSTYYQAWLNGRKVFIKYSDENGDFKEEFRLCMQFHRVNANNCQEALFYSADKHYRCIVVEFLEAESLGDKILCADFSPSERERAIIQLKDIAKSLVESGIVYRDLHLGNCVLTKDGMLKLIDFGAAVDNKQHGKHYTVSKNPVLLLPLLVDKLVGRCYVDSIFRMLKILEEIGYQESYRETYREVEAFLKEHAKKNPVRYIYRQICHSHFFSTLRELRSRSISPFFRRLKRIFS